MKIIGKSPSEQKIKVGEWTFSDQVGILASPYYQTLLLEPRLSRLLYLLASHEKSIVSRDYLMEQIWRDTIVNEESLTRAIADLRKVLLNNFPEGPKIDTIRKRGYLFSLGRTPKSLALKWNIKKKQVPVILTLIALIFWLLLF